LNIVLIAALFLSHLFHWRVGNALAWATTISGVVQAGWLAISCARAKISIPLLLPHLTESSRRLFKQIGPGAVGAGATQINLLISTILASTLPTGAISFLFYADRLNQLPLGIVGIAVATTLLPLLSTHVAKGDEKAVQHYTSRAIEFCLALGLPATIGLSLAALPIIVTLFEHGAFTHTDAVETAHALAAYSFGVPPFLLVKVFSARFFARHDTRTPVKVALAAMATNVVMSLFLLGLFQHIGIALATSIATWVNAGLLFTQLRKKGEHRGDAQLSHRLPRLLACAAGMALTTFLLASLTESWFEHRNIPLEMGGLTLIIAVSGLVYGLLLHLTGAFRLEALLQIIRPKET
jgi:putative peptidoglycan lipid II flippase